MLQLVFKMALVHSVEFHYFAITQILREINLGDSVSATSAILTHLQALNFEFLNFCTI